TVLGVIHILDARSHQQLMVLRGGASRINALAFSPDGTQLASADGLLNTSFTDYTVRLWNVSGRIRERVLRGHTGPVNSVAFSPDGKLIASSSCDQGDHDNHSDTHDHRVLLWNARTGRVVGRLQGASPICGVAFSPKGKKLATAGDDNSATLWDLARRTPIEPPFVGHSDVLNSVAF